MLRDDLESGRLEPLLLEWSLLPEYRVFAVYPHRRFVSAKVRVFLEALHTAFGDGNHDPWWPEGGPATENGRRRAG
jgi:DNA-binding transcriptional LysR family regulator